MFAICKNCPGKICFSRGLCKISCRVTLLSLRYGLDTYPRQLPSISSLVLTRCRHKYFLRLDTVELSGSVRAPRCLTHPSPQASAAPTTPARLAGHPQRAPPQHVTLLAPHLTDTHLASQHIPNIGLLVERLARFAIQPCSHACG